MTLWLSLGWIGAGLVALVVSIFVGLPCILSVVAWWMSFGSLEHSALYTGTVWHTRWHPKKHAFSYPIFLFALDLDELEDFRRALWPLVPWIVDFRDQTDHLKNGEGLSDQDSNSLLSRILRLVAQKTKNAFVPSEETHRVVILTHLCYYGYNFNPVSFYYVLDKATNKVEAMVGEVSNTPWTEMHCYVLHPDSTDKVTVRESNNKVDYSFPKEFHVSPFMEMDYWYDWTFLGTPGDPMTVVNILRKQESDRIEFTAKLLVEPTSLHPLAVAWQMIRFPVFCFLIQIWIHYQAALLFLKGIVYIPHPQGSETAASKTIATIMVPFFAIQDYFFSDPQKPKHA